LRVKNDKSDTPIFQQNLTERLCKHVNKDGFADGEVQLTVGFGTIQDIVIQDELPDSVLQVLNFRWANETLYLNGDFASCLLGCHKSLRAQVNVQIFGPPI